MEKICVLGLGVSGSGAVRFLLNEGKSVVGCDRRDPSSPDIAELIKEGMVYNKEEFDPDCHSLILSSGIPTTHPMVKIAEQHNIPWYGEAEYLLSRFCDRTILGITGTNGKTTVATLTAHLLNQNGVPAVALGNIGPSFSEIAHHPKETLIVGEFSSYQLETLQTPCLDAAVILNITPDHLDRYSSFEEYAAAKWRIAKVLKPKGQLAVHTSLQGGDLTFGEKGDLHIKENCVFFREQNLCALPKELSGFSIINYLAAVWLTSHYLADHTKLGALKNYKKPPHRLQELAQWKKRRVIDDGKATNVASVLAAVEALQGPIHLLVGGRHKGESYHPWRSAFLDKVVKLYIFGEAAEYIARDTKGAIPIEVLGSLEEAVRAAKTESDVGETILLSPGCSSFDSYSNYIARSRHFQELMQQSPCLVKKREFGSRCLIQRV